MVKDLDLKDIEKEIGKVKSIRYFCFVSVVCFLMGCSKIAFGISYLSILPIIVIGAMCIAACTAILIFGVMANRYKDISENLIKQLRQSDQGI